MGKQVFFMVFYWFFTVFLAFFHGFAARRRPGVHDLRDLEGARAPQRGLRSAVGHGDQGGLGVDRVLKTRVLRAILIGFHRIFIVFHCFFFTGFHRFFTVFQPFLMVFHGFHLVVHDFPPVLTFSPAPRR